jgi:hypothetical protein
MSEPVVVRFLTSHHVPGGALYTTGEIAGFQPKVADELITKGIAECHDSGLGPGVPSPAGGAGPAVAHQAVLADEAKAKRP